MDRTCKTCKNNKYDSDFLECFCLVDHTNIAMITLGWEGKCPFYKEKREHMNFSYD